MFPKEPRGNSLILGLSLLIDWFNPLQNKLSGHQASMGVIALNCLNLPPCLCYQPAFTYLSRIIPGPNQPNMFTISNILGPLVKKLLESNQGIMIHTPKYPKGHKVIVKLAAFIGDVVATHKKKQLKLGRCRSGQDVCNTSFAYHKLESHTKKEKLAKKTGICWSELNRLPYWNPVLNFTLVFIHNWFEGILQHHLNDQWGFARNLERRHDSSAGNSNLGSEAMDSSQNNYQSKKFSFSDSNKKTLISHIYEVVVPNVVTRIQKRLGESHCGRLKASEFNALVNIYIPLAALDVLFSDQQDFNFDLEQFMINLCALVQFTSIVTSKALNKDDSIKSLQTYEVYRETSSELFENVKLNPNHHYTMHLPDHLDWWGPPMGVSEFAGERLVGILQNIKNNHLNGKLLIPVLYFLIFTTK
ncbi:hypothetical protein O181_068821 [Austropuccinia psidii MF-1]|uniref:Uncharacterized protein n=1 Tax=Austropuccinia psidii MF-1 TaxID=1389203 RepID=A0A9Q3I490_9BASI|nr:hypothetical protein [Austropuccinia psidii MF-1]